MVEPALPAHCRTALHYSQLALFKTFELNSAVHFIMGDTCTKLFRDCCACIHTDVSPGDEHKKGRRGSGDSHGSHGKGKKKGHHKEKHHGKGRRGS